MQKINCYLTSLTINDDITKVSPINNPDVSIVGLKYLQIFHLTIEKSKINYLSNSSMYTTQ